MQQSRPATDQPPPLAAATGGLGGPRSPQSRRSSLSSSSAQTPAIELPAPIFQRANKDDDDLVSLGDSGLITLDAEVHLRLRFGDNYTFPHLPPPGLLANPETTSGSQPAFSPTGISPLQASPPYPTRALPTSASSSSVATLPSTPFPRPILSLAQLRSVSTPAVTKASKAPGTIALPPECNAPRPALQSTPTAELGPFEYPVPAPVVPGRIHRMATANSPVPPSVAPPSVLATSPASTVSLGLPRVTKHRRTASASTTASTTSSVATADSLTTTPTSTLAPSASLLSASTPSLPIPIPIPATTDDLPDDIPLTPELEDEKRRRRRSIASGQIPLLAANPLLAADPDARRKNSSSSFSDPPSRNTSPVQHPRRPRYSHGERDRATSPRPFSGTGYGPLHLPAAQPRRGAPIAFAHSALPAPIPPSLLARRGSVPALRPLPPPKGGWAAGSQSATASAPSPTSVYVAGLPNSRRSPTVLSPGANGTHGLSIGIRAGPVSRRSSHRGERPQPQPPAASTTPEMRSVPLSTIQSNEGVEGEDEEE